MSSQETILNEEQVRAIAGILADEFDPAIRKHDPHFSGFVAVSPWTAEREGRIFKELPVFMTEEVKRDLKYYKQVCTHAQSSKPWS